MARIYVVSARLTEAEYQQLTQYARENGVDNLSDLVRDGPKPILGDSAPKLKDGLAALERRLDRLERAISARIPLDAAEPDGRDDAPVLKHQYLR